MRKMTGAALLVMVIAGALLWSYESRVMNNDTDMTVKPAEIPEETERIFNVIGQKVQWFDLNVDPDQVFMIKIWVEHFEHGVQKENVIDYGSGIDRPDPQEKPGKLHHKQLVLIFSQNNDAQHEQRRLSFTSALINDRGSSSATKDVYLPLPAGSQMMWMNSVENGLSLDQPITLGSIIEFDGHTVNPGAGSVQEYDATGELPEELKRHERVFLFRMMLQGHE